MNFSIKNIFSIPAKIKTIEKIIADFNPDIIHAHQANSCSYLAVKANKKKIPLIITCWGSDVLLLPQRNVVFRKLVSYSLGKANAITADADYMIEAVKKMGIDKPIINANFGIELPDAYKNLPKENIIYSNRLHKELYKIDEVIRGFSDFVKKHADWKLVVGANGPLTEELKNLAKQILPEGSYQFIGFVGAEENALNYAKAKIWISVPESDGTAISLLEAMGYGCIPVLSDLPANKEWVKDSSNGIIVNSSVCDALEKAVKLNSEFVKSTNQSIIETKATKEINREKFKALYLSVIGA